MRIHVDRDQCQNLGICEGLSPKLFEIGVDGTLTVKCEDVTGSAILDAETAVDACPTQALSLRDD